MNWSFPLALMWLITANVIAMFPSRDHHWRTAYGLIAIGIPLLIWLGIEQGPWWALLFLIAAGSVLRWPVVYLGRWLRRLV